MRNHTKVVKDRGASRPMFPPSGIETGRWARPVLFAMVLMALLPALRAHAEILPKPPNPPADIVYVVDLSRLILTTLPPYYGTETGLKETLAFLALAGLVNRSQPRILLKFWEEETHWFDWLSRREGFDIITLDHDHRYDIFTLFGEEAAEGLVLTDPLCIATNNIACVVAACEDRIACHPAYASEIIDRCPALTDVHDLGAHQFADNASAYQWAYDLYWPGCLRHDLLAWFDHRDLLLLASRPAAPRDYCVAHKIFPMWVDNPDPADPAYVFANETLLPAAEDNIPVIGWPGTNLEEYPLMGLGEYMGLELWGRHGKFGVVDDKWANLSFYAGCAPVTVTQHPADPPAFDIDTIYYATYHSEGELLWLGGPFYDKWSYDDIGYGWSLGPLQQEIIPGILDWYLEGDEGVVPPLNPKAELVSAMSGVGYILPHLYKEEALDGFLDLTAQYLQINDMSTIALHFWQAESFEAAKQRAVRYGEHSRLGPVLNGLFAGYGYHQGLVYSQSNYLAGEVPTFHSLAPWDEVYDAPPVKIAEEFLQRLHGHGAPAFAYVFFAGWSNSTAQGIELLEALNAAGAESPFVCVRPDELGLLYRESGAGVELDFLDEFVADDSWTAESGLWTVGDGLYIQTDPAAAWHISRAGNCQWDSVVVSAEVRADSGGDPSGIALFGRYRGMDNAYYRFDLWKEAGQGSARLVRKTRGAEPVVLASMPFDWDFGRDYTATIKTLCDRILCLVDGETLIDVVDETPVPRGWIALGSFGGGTTVDRVSVSRPENCVDCDGDGYGNPACEEGGPIDCDDRDGLETPAGREGPYGDMSCSDGIDNNCDGLFDGDDRSCRPPETDEWSLASRSYASTGDDQGGGGDGRIGMILILLIIAALPVAWKGFLDHCPNRG